MSPAVDSERDDPFAIRLSDLLAWRTAGSLNIPNAARPGGGGGVGVPTKGMSVGRGLEFTEIRPYSFGDSARQIDWRHTAKQGRFYSKVFAPEGGARVWLCPELGRRLSFATQGVTKRLQVARVCAVLAWAAARRGDSIGAVLSNGGNRIVVPPTPGEVGVYRVLQKIVSIAEAEDAMGPEPGSWGRMPFTHGDQAWFLGDFPDDDLMAFPVGPGWNCIHVFDPIEVAPPPPGIYRLVSEDGERIIDASDPKVRAKWGAPLREQANLLRSRFQAAGGGHLLLSTQDDPRMALRGRSIFSARGAT